MPKIRTALALCALAGSLQANGLTGADVLKSRPSARANAMGEAYGALGDDLGSLSFNPAGLKSLKSPSLSFLHHIGVAGLGTEHIAYGHPLEYGTFAAALLYRGQPDIANPLASDAPISANDLVLSLHWGARPGQWLSGLPEILAAADAGIGIKYIHSQLGRYGADGVAVDLGLRAPLGEGVIGSVSVLNLGPPIKFIEVADPLPSNILLGVARSFEPWAKNRLNLSADAELPMIGAFRGHFGVEDWLGPAFALRAGYLMDSAQSLSGMSAGFGMKLDQEGLLFQFDYAFRPFYYDGFSSYEAQHLFEMSLGF